MGSIVYSGGSIANIEITPEAIRQSIEITSGFTQDYAAIFRTHRSVQTVVAAIARQIAQLGLHLYRRVDEADRERVRDHDLARLLRNPDTGVTRYRFMYSLVADLAIYDRAYLVRVANGDEKRLVRLSPKEVMFFPADRSKKARFHIGGVDIDPEKVIYIRGYAPEQEQHGVSPIESLRRALAEDWQAGLTREQLFRNGARLSGYLERPASAPKWSPDAKRKFARAWRDQYTSQGTNPGGTPILEDGMKFNSASMNAVDLQYIEARKLTREEVAAAYHIPAPMVGILENATFSNIREQHQMLYQDTLGPWLQWIQQELELGLFEWFGLDDEFYLEFNIEEKLRGSFEEQAAMLTQSVGAPWMSRNEARALRNMPRVEGGDELVTPLNVLAGDAGGTPDPFKRRVVLAKAAESGDGEKPSDDEDDGRVLDLAAEMRDFFEEQRRALKAQKARFKAAPMPVWWDEQKWDDKLTQKLSEHLATLTRREGRDMLRSLGLDTSLYDLDRTKAYLQAMAESNASSINAATRMQIQGALDEGADFVGAVDDVCDDAVSRRSGQIGQTIVTEAKNWARQEAAVQASGDRKVYKEWVVTSSNPRPEHAVLNGERVGLDETFSNGAQRPGDWGALDVDEIAGCDCELVIGWDD